jgi:hypothetical protein
MAYVRKGDAEGDERVRSFMGPGQVDLLVRQAIQCAWMMLPEQESTAAEAGRLAREIVDRALSNLREEQPRSGGRIELE